MLQSAQRVLATFTSWDLDGSGTLSKQEFSAISQVSCPVAAVHRSSMNAQVHNHS